MSRSWLPVLALTVASVACGYWITDLMMGGGAPVAEEVERSEAKAPDIVTSPVAPPVAPPAALATPAPAPPSPQRPPSQTVGVSESPPAVARPSLPRAWEVMPSAVESVPDEEEEEPKATNPADAPLASAVVLDEPDMTSMQPDAEEYDEVIEALQRFHDYEKDIQSYDELTPAVWEEIQARHMPETQKLLDRAAELNQLGYPAEAESLLLEWDLLEAKYAKMVK